MKIKLSEKNNFSSAALLILLILIIAGVLCFMILGLRSFNLIELPPFVEKLFFKNDEIIVEFKSDDSNIYNFLENNSNSGLLNIESDDTYVYMFDVTIENVREVIDSIAFPENIYIVSEAKYYYNNSVSKIMEISLWKKGGNFRYLINTNSRDEELYINNGTKEYIKNYLTDSSITKNSNSLFAFESVPNIPNINYYLNMLNGAQITNCAFMRDNDTYENIAHIKYEIPELNQRENIYVSLDTGIVLKVRSTYGNENTVYYEYTADVREAYNGVSDDQKTIINDELFDIN